MNFGQTLVPGFSLSSTLRTKWKLYYSNVHSQIQLAAQFTSWVLWHFQNDSWKAGFFVLKGQKMRPSLKLKNFKSEKWARLAFEISHGNQLLCQVSAKSVDHKFLPLEHFLRQWHLSPFFNRFWSREWKYI